MELVNRSDWLQRVHSITMCSMCCNITTMHAHTKHMNNTGEILPTLLWPWPFWLCMALPGGHTHTHTHTHTHSRITEHSFYYSRCVQYRAAGTMIHTAVLKKKSSCFLFYPLFCSTKAKQLPLRLKQILHKSFYPFSIYEFCLLHCSHERFIT